MIMDVLKQFVMSVCPMPDDEFSQIEGLVSLKHVAKGDFLLREGDVCHHIFFLQKGFVRLYYIDSQGVEINYRFTGEHNFFVDFKSFLTQTPSRYYWQAMQNADVWAFRYQDVQALYRRSSAWNQFGRLMAERVYLMMNERVEFLQFLAPEQRYQQLLHTYPDWLTQVSQAHLASYLGITPESLSRIRRRLEKKGGS